MRLTTPADARAASTLGERALVIGGSLTGLVAARALAAHFDEVVLVERDRLPDGPEARKGVPQAHHVHVLLKQGERILGEYFPGILHALLGAGATRVDMAGDTRWLYFGGWKARFRSGMEMLSQSRAFLEWRVREHLGQVGNVRLLGGRTAQGLVIGAAGRVRGARLAGTDADGGTEELAADLVVDASGRGSRTPRWLRAAGYDAPAESEIQVDVGYASRLYRRTVRPGRDWLGLMIYPEPPGTRLGVLFPVENDRWLVTLVGWFGDHPGASDEAFLGFARSLDAPDLHDAIAEAEPLSPVALHRFPSDRRRHYERLAHLPEGLAVLGDAFCSFNPIYGQGMTTGALGARTLDEELAAQVRRRRARFPLEGFTRRFHRRLARVIATPWLVTTAEDLRSRAAVGPRPSWIPLLHWYTERVHRLTWRDPFVGRRVLEVMHLTGSPGALFHPYVVYRALTLPARA